MKYAVLQRALALRGHHVDVSELSKGQVNSDGDGAMLPRPSGRVLTVSPARITGGPHDGAIAVLAAEESHVQGVSPPDPMIYLGYEDADTALQDVYRVIVGTALKDGSIKAIAGWGADAVVLLPGAFDGRYTVRIASVLGDPEDSGLYPGGEIAPEQIADSGDIFADAIDELIDDLDKRADELAAAGRHDDAAVLSELALPWLRKEAAQHRAATARQHFLAAAHASGGLVGPGGLMTMSALARNLYTDRGNLTRTINQGLREEGSTPRA
jgi:hypothetical protein